MSDDESDKEIEDRDKIAKEIFDGTTRHAKFVCRIKTKLYRSLVISLNIAVWYIRPLA